uniref:Putative capsid protein n=1 Tax=viral metagenome TaxID=1070528 RepID=A0A6M3KHV0_9ZZZZ
MGSPLTDKAFVRLLTAGLEEDFYGGYKELESIKEKIFDVTVSKNAWTEFFGIGDVPDPQAFNGLVSYQDVAPGFHTKLEPKEFAGGILITRRLMDTDRYGQIKTMSKNLGKAAKRKKNKIAHEPFIYMDSSAFDYMIAEEGVALCSNSHTSKASVSTTSGFDNLVALPFNAVNLEAARLVGKRFKTDINERFESNMDMIVYPSSLAEKVWEVIKSPGKVDEITNNVNFQQGRWKSLELTLWDDYDVNNFAIVDSSFMKDCLKWQQGIAEDVETASTIDFDTMIMKYRSYFVDGWAWIDWRFIVGSVNS